jgi:hypothetical protein
MDLLRAVSILDALQIEIVASKPSRFHRDQLLYTGAITITNESALAGIQALVVQIRT